MTLGVRRCIVRSHWSPTNSLQGPIATTATTSETVPALEPASTEIWRPLHTCGRQVLEEGRERSRTVPASVAWWPSPAAAYAAYDRSSPKRGLCPLGSGRKR